jgi:hypothetical protein
MMRYRSTTHFSEIENVIRRNLLDFGLVARLAKDAALVEDLWENIVLYMQYSRYGVAIFEDIEERDFNPNISLELGFMYALKKRCLLLKEKRMPRLPTDICGRIYRNFDCYDIAASLSSEIRNWCANDLGLQERSERVEAFEISGVVVFDNRTDDPEFSTWGSVSSDGLHGDHLTLVHPKAISNPEEAVPVMKLSTAGVEYVGLNKAVPFLRGKMRFEFMAVRSSATNPNLLFCMIPMKGICTDLIEVGAQRRAERANAYSPYRERYFVPEDQIGDGSWHYASLEFDFTKIRDASYSIFAPRINEGCPRPGPGELKIRNVELYVASEDIEAPPNTAVPPDLFRATRSTGR